jgi:hypothetical protein
MSPNLLADAPWRSKLQVARKKVNDLRSMLGAFLHQMRVENSTREQPSGRKQPGKEVAVAVRSHIMHLANVGDVVQPNLRMMTSSQNEKLDSSILEAYSLLAYLLATPRDHRKLIKLNM